MGPQITKYRCVVRTRFLENGSLFKANDGMGELFKNRKRFSQGVSQKGKSSHDDEYGHGQEKRRPSPYVEGKRSISKHLAVNFGKT